tara:strand:+ start:1566 stop:2459 length:894 start_codon:yes stop_codon:yes gene_type:complete
MSSDEEENFSDIENETDNENSEEENDFNSKMSNKKINQSIEIPYVDYSEVLNNSHIIKEQFTMINKHFKETIIPPQFPHALSFLWENICLGAYNKMFLNLCKKNVNMENAYLEEKKQTLANSIKKKLENRVNKLKKYYVEEEQKWKEVNKTKKFIFIPPSINDDYELHIFWHHIINSNYEEEYIYQILNDKLIYQIYLEHIKDFKQNIYMTKYEFARIKGLRLEQLSRGAIPYIRLEHHPSLSYWVTDTNKKIFTIEDIFEEEMHQKAVPLIVRRSTSTSKVYYFYVKDMDFSEYIK